MAENGSRDAARAEHVVQRVSNVHSHLDTHSSIVDVRLTAHDEGGGVLGAWRCARGGGSTRAKKEQSLTLRQFDTFTTPFRENESRVRVGPSQAAHLTARRGRALWRCVCFGGRRRPGAGWDVRTLPRRRCGRVAHRVVRRGRRSRLRSRRSSPRAPPRRPRTTTAPLAPSPSCWRRATRSRRARTRTRTPRF